MTYQDPYQYQYQQQPPAGTRTNTMAILSLVFAFVFWPLGIVFGHLGRRQIRQTGEGGGGLATAGLVISYIFGVLTVIGCGLWIAAVFFVANHPGVIPTPTP
jgi:short subunit fatty acids transporter